MRKADAGDALTQLAIALRTVEVPDTNTGAGSLGPNEIRNQAMAHGEYVHAYYSGAFHLTLVDPNRTYTPARSDRVGRGRRSTGWQVRQRLVGTRTRTRTSTRCSRSWKSAKYGEDGEGILTVRSLRGQF